jgi:hypothetical protein
MCFYVQMVERIYNLAEAEFKLYFNLGPKSLIPWPLKIEKGTLIMPIYRVVSRCSDLLGLSTLHCRPGLHNGVQVCG